MNFVRIIWSSTIIPGADYITSSRTTCFLLGPLARYAVPNVIFVPVVGPQGGPRQRTAESALARRVAKRPDPRRAERTKEILREHLRRFCRAG